MKPTTIYSDLRHRVERMTTPDPDLEKDIMLLFVPPKRVLEMQRSILSNAQAALDLVRFAAPSMSICLTFEKSEAGKDRWICTLSGISFVRSGIATTPAPAAVKALLAAADHLEILRTPEEA
jgi:hypothetical protein